MADSMQEIMNPGLAAKKDPDFPNAPEGWDKAAAMREADAQGLELNSVHWEALRALQEYFAKNETPNMRGLQDALEEKFHSKGGRKFLYGLFPNGPVAQGCKLAGLEPPTGAIDHGFGSVT